MIEPMFWIKLFFVLAVLSLLIFIFNTAMRKFLKVEKRKIFSYNHVNEKHKKIDWTIRISFLIIFLITYFYQTRSSDRVIWYLETWFVILMFLVISEIVRAFMEWKYAENRKAYIFTISQLIFILALLGIGFTSNFFNFF
ncbi:MAG: DUF4181 domain-containing protein [Gudongella sp.]|nr:DUF4181 domain-containing protein [Gudongella sp.]